MIAANLLDTPLVITQEMSEADIEALWQITFQRAQMTQAFLERRIDCETYLDFMAQSGIEPEELLDAAEENLDFIFNQAISIEL